MEILDLIINIIILMIAIAILFFVVKLYNKIRDHISNVLDNIRIDLAYCKKVSKMNTRVKIEESDNLLSDYFSTYV